MDVKNPPGWRNRPPELAGRPIPFAVFFSDERIMRQVSVSVKRNAPQRNAPQNQKGSLARGWRCHPSGRLFGWLAWRVCVRIVRPGREVVHPASAIVSLAAGRMGSFCCSNRSSGCAVPSRQQTGEHIRKGVEKMKVVARATRPPISRALGLA